MSAACSASYAARRASSSSRGSRITDGAAIPSLEAFAAARAFSAGSATMRCHKVLPGPRAPSAARIRSMLSGVRKTPSGSWYFLYAESAGRNSTRHSRSHHDSVSPSSSIDRPRSRRSKCRAFSISLSPRSFRRLRIFPCRPSIPSPSSPRSRGVHRCSSP